jgi:uncharacterized membrane protein
LESPASRDLSRTTVDRTTWFLLALLGAFTLASVLGYGAFALHPERLPDSDLARRVFTIAFPWFARLHIALAGVVLLVALHRRLGARWIVPFSAVFGLAFLAEHVGTGFGYPFGGYAYSGLLGPKLGGRVPVLIPLSWFLMALPAWLFAHAAIPRRRARTARLTLASAWLVAWDLALDPAMSYLTPYWSWADSGPYYGMPLINLVGWFVTGLTLAAVLEASAERAEWHRLSLPWFATYFGLMVLMPLGMLAAAGAWPAVLTTVFALAWLAALSAAKANALGSDVRRTLSGLVARA